MNERSELEALSQAIDEGIVIGLKRSVQGREFIIPFDKTSPKFYAMVKAAVNKDPSMKVWLASLVRNLSACLNNPEDN